MAIREVIPGVSWIGAIDWDRRLFDALIPLPEGTSYNAFLVSGSEKKALIDTVDPPKEYELVSNLVKAGVESVDYIIVNHAEQDHSGSLPMAAELFPGAQIVVSEKCRDLVVSLLGIAPERCMVVKDGDTISLGDKTLEFIMAPWVHWPETMLTYLREDRILFSCDLFGSHLATSDLFISDVRDIYPLAKRYYAEIMMPFRSIIREHLARLSSYDIRIIAPSHGPLYRSPDTILDAYREWTSDNVRNEVVIIYVSMHGSTEKMVTHLTDALLDRAITVRVFNLVASDLGDIAMSLVDAATVVIGTPTMLFGPHPLVANAAYITNLLRPKTRFAAVIGSYGWGGNTVDILKGMLLRLTAEMLEPVYVKGAPDSECLRDLEALADTIATKHKQISAS
ncbi:MAG TPA: FprA family A-type flavoprotein [Methanoregulaceae archaeon]|nr:MAG: FprA family A-type flavoprotein [Methanolinea sp.]HON81285.1 FprA family A-type flavoprotein [Methanoregulaceae archaeon]HPD10109.1 FprA family A-type flavoprotein [Methanoregulaceae archaeon]HRT15115.1 FprA family A-type flavoprotein [Methanoregulaceae archaeon]HRU30768.1 FprA family A-type flavoprotein [Methanoregulaceae archaeon]